MKTSLRSTMGNEHVTSVSLLYFHKDIDINIDEVIDKFARHFPRRLQLGNIFKIELFNFSYFTLLTFSVHVLHMCPQL